MLSGDCESPILSGVIVNPNIILQGLLICTFSFGVAGALVNDSMLCGIGLFTAFGCAMLLAGRDDE
jgi:hypothetical protein